MKQAGHGALDRVAEALGGLDGLRDIFGVAGEDEPLALDGALGRHRDPEAALGFGLDGDEFFPGADVHPGAGGEGGEGVGQAGGLLGQAQGMVGLGEGVQPVTAAPLTGLLRAEGVKLRQGVAAPAGEVRQVLRGVAAQAGDQPLVAAGAAQLGQRGLLGDEPGDGPLRGADGGGEGGDGSGQSASGDDDVVLN